MATIVKLGEPRPPARKQKPEPEHSASTLQDLQENGLLLKIGIGVGVAVLIATLSFFLFRGPAEEANTLAPGNGLPMLGGPPGISPAGPPGGHVPGGLPAAGLPAASPSFQPAAAPPPPMAPGGAVGNSGVPPGYAPPVVPSQAHGGTASVTTGGAARPAVTKSTQPAPNEDPYTRENR